MAMTTLMFFFVFFLASADDQSQLIVYAHVVIGFDMEVQPLVTHNVA